MTRPLTIIDAPSNLGLKPPGPGREPGVCRMPEALRACGLLRRVEAADGGRVAAPPYRDAIDPDSGIRNAAAIAAYSSELADALQPIVVRTEFPVVLGGDCSILLGSALALRRLGRYGLLYLDGHVDLLTPQTSESKGAAGMDLALVTGRGPDLLADLAGLRPLVSDSDVVVLGYRDSLGEYGALGKAGTRPAFEWHSYENVQRRGAAATALRALTHLRRGRLDGVWIHLDVDVLDSTLMPAVDSPQPAGFTYDDLGTILRTMLKSGLATGLQVTIFDPDLDTSGELAESLTSFLAGVLRDGVAARPTA